MTQNRPGELLPFLTAWDPSDLPGGSLDPLGFDRGYGCLADKILPGLTNVARQPRYFGLICAGALLGPDITVSTRADVQVRQDALLRLERYWALANVLSAKVNGQSASGVRGVTYAEAQQKELERKGQRSTDSRFVLLSRQLQYGVVGIYGNVAHGLRLLDRKTLAPTSDFGETLGAAFLEETGAPKSLRAAVQDPDRDVGVDVLRVWGEKANLTAKPGPEEARILGQALQLDPVRARMAAALERSPYKGGETELERLKRTAGRLGRDDKDLAEAIEAILAFEDCFGWILLSFERILWRCSFAGSISLGALTADEVIEKCTKSTFGAVLRFERAIENAKTPEFTRDLERLKDVRAFFVELSRSGLAPAGFVDLVLKRHADVQHGKFDRGRRKLPWVETTNDIVILTLTRATQVGGEPRRPGDLEPHEYRTASAEALNRAAGRARQ